jgi:hypothetical protein
MQIQLKVLSTVVNSRVLRSGDDKGQTKYSVDFYAHTGDMVPSKFVISGLASQADAEAIAAKYPHNSTANVRLVPRDALWLDAADLQPVTK